MQSILSRRTYASESGAKEMTVRDALNEALSEELESNEKTFIMGEEVAQYNGAYVLFKTAMDQPKNC
jgi:pyruvate dehydrogenase E1 component beta subunit